MKKIGIVGGLGPESTLYYYRIFIDLCRQIKELDGGYPELVIYSVNMREIMKLRDSGQEDAAQLKLLEAIDSLHKAGADFAIIACNAIPAEPRAFNFSSSDRASSIMTHPACPLI